MCDYGGRNAGAYTKIDDKQYVAAVERPCVLGTLSLSGRRVLDFGCGSGRYSRWIKRAGAARVLGIDPSEAQIELARKAEAESPIGVEYRCVSVEPEPLGQFDLVMAIWVVIVAKTEPLALDLFRHAYENLKPGGKYLMWTSLVPEDEAGRKAFVAAYDSDGIHFDIESSSSEPVVTKLTIGEFVAPNYFFGRETHERLLREVGFSQVEIVPAKARPADDRWDAFARDTGMCAVVATKA